MDISTHGIISHEHGSPRALHPTNLRWLSLRAWNLYLWVGMFLFLFLEVERHLAKAKVRSVVAARHEIRVLFKNLDAVSNFEHLLFGFCCALAAYLVAQTLHHFDPAFAAEGVKGSAKGLARRRGALGIPVLGRAAEMIGAAIRRYTPSPATVYAFWGARSTFRLAVRSGCTVAVVAVLCYFRRAAYSAIDIIPAMWLFAVAMWMVWGWRHILKTTAEQPEFVMLVFGFGIWFEFDLAWKIVQLAEHKNTFLHAATHLAYSFGTFSVSLAWFRLVVMRRRS